MNAPIAIAHLCGPLRQALAVVNGETWLYEDKEPRRPTANEIQLFFQHGLEVRALEPTADGALNEEKLFSALDIEGRRFDTLQRLLMGMDADLTDDLRKQSMRRADRLLVDRAVAEFVEIRFLRPVKQQIWDLD